MPIAKKSRWPNLRSVNSALPVKSIADFVAYAKARPGELRFRHARDWNVAAHRHGNVHAGAPATRLVHVPYQARRAGVTDLMSGAVNVNVQSAPTCWRKPTATDANLAVFSRQQIKELPNVPTMEESGLKDFVITSWLAVFGPPGLPEEVRDRLSRAIVEIVQQPKFQEKFLGLGLEPVGTDAATFAQLYYEEVNRWKKVAIERGIRIAE